MPASWLLLVLILGFYVAGATSSTAPLVRQAQQAEQQGRMPEAANFYQQALAADPHSFDALTGFAMLLGQAGQHTKTVKLFKKAAKLVCKPPNQDITACVGIKMNMVSVPQGHKRLNRII